MNDDLELIRGHSVRIRLMRESDAPHIVEWRNRPEIQEWLIQWEPLTLESHLRWFAKRVAAGDILIVFEMLDGTRIGSTSLQDFDYPRTSCEWGRLCAARMGAHSSEIVEGCYLVHRFCFDMLDLHRLYGAVAGENQRAWRIYQFLGWQDEGMRRQHWAKPDGTFMDARMIGCFPSEFAAARGAMEAKLYGGGTPPPIDPAHTQRMRERFGPRRFAKSPWSA